MSEFEEGPGPIDSDELYQMGLRPARCAGCEAEKLTWELGDKCLITREHNGTCFYELDAKPRHGQGRKEYMGRPVRFKNWFSSTGHSDECYHWTPPKENDDPPWLQGVDTPQGELPKTPEEFVKTIHSKSVARRLYRQLEPSGDTFAQKVRALIKDKLDL